MAADAAGAPSRGCAPAGATVLRASALARLYSQGSTLYGCTATHRTRLGTLRAALPAPGARIARYALGGRYAAIDLARMGVDTFASSIAVYDLRSGRSIGDAPATAPENRAQSFVTVSALAVNADGVAAWIGQRSAIGALRPVHELHVLAGGADSLKASGTATLTGLRLATSRVSWVEGGSTHRSAAL